LISPIHGAAIASVVANAGLMRKPYLINSLRDDSGVKIWENPSSQEIVIEAETADDLRKMMISTVTEGTAKRAFRRPTASLRSLEIGGKTGSITGGDPYGKRDWFVAYAKEQGSKTDSGISLCVMIVNKKKWYVKSSYLAREIIDYYWQNKQRLSYIKR
jgi:cell division protein FtsI/penicillin-binding protein 2